MILVLFAYTEMPLNYVHTDASSKVRSLIFWSGHSPTPDTYPLSCASSMPVSLRVQNINYHICCFIIYDVLVNVGSL